MSTLVAPTRSPFRSNAFLESRWPERLAALLAVAGVLLSILVNFHVHALRQSGSDIKTMYGSAAALRHGLNGYSFDNIAAVFERNAIAEPTSWYAHAPVYPPFTLMLLVPLTALPMAAAVYAWVILSGIVFASALGSLARFAAEEMELGRAWCLLLVGLGAASPLLSFALEMGNVSVVVCGLCLPAVTAPERSRRWPRAASLALGLLLKPHLTVWVVLALVFSQHRRSRQMAWGAVMMACAAVAVLAATLASRDLLATEVGGYVSMLRGEMGVGSMSAGSRDLVAVAAQITSLDSLTSFWGLRLPVLDAGVLAAGCLALAVCSLRLRAPSASLRLVLVGAWCSLGLLATYHRAHDGIMLLVLLPWVLATVRNRWRSLEPWIVVGLGFALSWGPRWETLEWLSGRAGVGPAAELLLYRQAPLAALLLACLLMKRVVRTAFAGEAMEGGRYRAMRALPRLPGGRTIHWR